MIRSNIKKQFSCDRNKLWNIITDNSNYAWRSDLSKIVIVDLCQVLGHIFLHILYFRI